MATNKPAGTKPPAKPATKAATKPARKPVTRWEKLWNGVKKFFAWIWSNILKILGIILIVAVIVLFYRVATGKIQIGGRQEKIAAVDPVDTVTPVEKQEGLQHTAYWTVATTTDHWPDLSQFDIVACHSDPDSDGNAKVVFLIGNVTDKDLQLTYFNGYAGTWSESAKQQILREIQDSVRPHVPGFNLNEVEIIHK